MQNITEILDSFYCPITQEIMTDPVICPEGHSFERNAIMTWLSKNPISPITRTKLEAFRLRPNRALKESIDNIRHLIDVNQLKKVTPLAIKCSQEMVDILQNSLNDIQLSMNYTKDYLNVCVKVPNSSTRAPANVVLVIDVSASMSTEATMKNDQGQDESHGFSLLDIVKQAAHTIRVSLKECDTLSVVSYSTDAKIIIQPTSMDHAGQLAVKSAIDGLTPDSRTNIWDGLFKALEICRENKSPEKHNKVLLLTDGQPNVIPPRGHVGMIRKYRDSHGELPASVDTFGFGYSLDSVDLNNIARECMGNYGFIPDSTMVGDMFSNCLANLLSVASPNSQLMLEIPEGVTFKDSPVMGNHNFEVTSWGMTIDTGALHYGQTKTFTFRINPLQSDKISQINATIQYSHFNESKQMSTTLMPQFMEDMERDMITYIRLAFVENVTEAWNQMSRGEPDLAKAIIKSFSSEISNSIVAGNEYIKDLMKDLMDQVTIAFSKQEYFQKWGRHYIPSLVRAHQHQICNNFKDPGVQHYGTELFNTIRDEADENYNKLPAPTPSANIHSSNHYRGMSNVTRSAAPVTMVSYNTRGGVCFHGDCQVKMYNGTLKMVKDIRQGDKILTTDPYTNYQDTIQCVIQTVFNQQKTDLVVLEGGWIGTPWHPIKSSDGKWVYPCQLSNPDEAYCQAVYSFLTVKRNSVLVNGIESCTLAHGIMGDPVVSHPFFGTEEIVNNLSQHPGWNQGYVQISNMDIMRDPLTGLVNELMVSTTNSDVMNV